MRCLPWFTYEETTNIYIKVSHGGFSIVATSHGEITLLTIEPR